MKIASFLGLAAAAVVLAGVAWLVARPHGDAGGGSGVDEPFIKGLDQKVNTVTAVTVKSAGKEFTLHQDASGAWHISDKGDYPAETEKVKQAVVGVSELHNAEPKTSKPDLYTKIGVEDPTDKPAAPGERSPVLLTLKDSGGTVLASLIVGNTKYGAKPAVYVRRAGEPQSWLAEGTLEVSAEPSAWMETKLLELPRDRVKSVTVTQAEGGVLNVFREKSSDTNFTVRDVPQGKELKSPTVGDPLAAGLAYLQFEDVTPVASFKTEGEGAAKPKFTADFRTFDGLVLVVQAFERDAKTWAKVVVTFDDAAAAPAENRPPALKSAEDAKKEATELASKFSNWVYQLPDWKAQGLAGTMASMLKDTPPAPPPSLPGAPGATGAPAAPGAPPMILPSPPPTSAAPTAPPAAPGPSGPTAPAAPPPAPTAPTGSTGPTAPTGEVKPGQ